MRTRLMFVSILVIGVALAAALGGGQPPDVGFTTDFRLENCSFSHNGGNPYWTLKPGSFFRYEGEDDGEFVELEITVLNQTKIIVFIVNGQLKTAKTRVIEEREWIDGELVEVSRNYFARCTKTKNMYYFGEDVDFYENGVIVGHEGSWIAGANGAQPGLIMPGLFLLGSKYFQEIAPGIAMDRAKHVDMGLEVQTPAGTFQDCVVVLETTPLEPGSQSEKIYAPGIGLINDDGVELVEYDLTD